MSSDPRGGHRRPPLPTTPPGSPVSQYTVLVNDVPAHYKPGHFPRKFRRLAEAKLAAQEAVRLGASMARVECPNGGEIDYRPQPQPKKGGKR